MICLKCNGWKRPYFITTSKRDKVCVLCMREFGKSFFHHLKSCLNKENFEMCICKIELIAIVSDKGN